MAAKDTPAEALLKKVRKLEENLTCPNCGTYNQFGFGSVCVKFKTFVCDLCKTSVGKHLLVLITLMWHVGLRKYAFTAPGHLS